VSSVLLFSFFGARLFEDDTENSLLDLLPSSPPPPKKTISEYWTLVMDVARRNNLKRILRCSQIMGKEKF
jgi:hypothetical protein